MELTSRCLAPGRRHEVGDLLSGIADLDGHGDPDPARGWQTGVSLVDITRVLHGGRSDAAVYEMAVHRPGRPVQRQVLKVGPLAEIVAEWRAYRTWLAGTPAATVTPVTAVSRTVSGPTGPQRLGAVVYQHVATYAGRSSVPVTTLEETVRATIEGSVPLDDTLAILRALLEQVDQSVWHDQPGHRSRTLAGLNPSLGPDLVLEVDRAADANTLTFQAPTDDQRRGKVRYSGALLERASLVTPPRPGPEAIEPGAVIELRDMVTAAGPDGSLRARFGHTTVEIRRADGADPHFLLLDYADHNELTVVGRVVALRGLRWWEKIERSVGTAARDDDTVIIDGIPIGDPFKALPARLDEFVEQRATTVVHGDLNPRNVLLVDRQIFLIDFARTGVGPPLSDAAWLELCLLRDVVAPLLGWPALVRLQRELALRTRAADAVTELPEPTGPAAAVLGEIRAGARRAHQRRGATNAWWREYQDHLLIGALRTLKWDDQTPAKVHAAMAAAGVAAEQLGPAPYRHWSADETLTAATATVPLLAAERAGSLDIAAEFTAAVDPYGLNDERVVRFGVALGQWRDRYVVEHHIESAAMVVARLAGDHDLYISLQAFIRLKGQLRSGFGRWAGTPFAEDPFDYLPRSNNPFGIQPGPPPEDVAPGIGEPWEPAAEAHPGDGRPAWAPVEVRDPDAIDLILGEWAVVVLGDAGSGKSTVASELQYQLARAVMSAAGRVPATDPAGPPDSHPSMPQLLPVTLRAPLVDRTLKAATDDDGVVQVAESLGRVLRDCLKEPVPLDLLRVGGVHVTIDAFNEVDPAGRQRIVAWIRWLRRTYARVPIVICHRRNGFNPAELPFPVVVLQSVSVGQARDYIRTALRLRKLPDHEVQAATLIRLLLDQPANPTIRDFARVPLYLWMITTRYARHGVVPANVGELFDGFSEWYLTERDTDEHTPHGYAYDERVRVLEIIARHLVENGNVTDITVEEARDLLAKAGLRRARERLDDLVAVDMLDRDGGQLRFHHQSFQEFFAARVLHREVGDGVTFRDHVLEFRWREPLQMMLSFSGGDPELARRLIDIALGADPRFAASLLRWTENPPVEATDGFLAAQERTLATENLGTFAWQRAAEALVELGTDAARSVLVRTVEGSALPVEARSATLASLLAMTRSNRFEDMRDTVTRDLTRAVTTILQSTDAASLRSEAAKAVGSARLTALAAHLVLLIDRDEAWPVARAAWNSLEQIGQVVPPAVRRRYAAMCADRLEACRAELPAASETKSITRLENERLELIDVLAEAGQIMPVLAHRFAYRLGDYYDWLDALEPAKYPGIAGTPLGRIMNGECSGDELLTVFRGDDDTEVAAAGHMILRSEDDDLIGRMVAAVTSESSPAQLLAAAAAVEETGADCAFALPIVHDLIGRFPDERYLEATVALIACVPLDRYEHVRLRLLALETISDEPVTHNWPSIDLWYSMNIEDRFISEMMLSGDEDDLRLAVSVISLDGCRWDGGNPHLPILNAEARDRLLAYARSVPVAELNEPSQSAVIEACARERLIPMIPRIIEAARQPDIFTTETLRVSADHGSELVIDGCDYYNVIGFLGRVAYQEGEHALAAAAHAFLTEIGPQPQHSVERARLIGLGILGDFVGLLTGLRSGDRVMLAAARNAVQIWHEHAPYAPSWATDLEAVGLWIIRRLAGEGESLAPDVRSTLGEIVSWIEQQIGRNLAG